MKATFDPTNSFTSVTNQDLLQACGFIPSWAMEWDDQFATERTLREHLRICYPYRTAPFEGFTIKEDASLSYEGDPDEKPILKLEFDDGTEMYQYLHAWVMIVEPGKPNFITRMD